MATACIRLLGSVQRDASLTPPTTRPNAGMTSGFIDENESSDLELRLRVDEFSTFFDYVGSVTLGSIRCFF